MFSSFNFCLCWFAATQFAMLLMIYVPRVAMTHTHARPKDTAAVTLHTSNPPATPLFKKDWQELHANCTQHANRANRAKWSRMEMTGECHSCVPFRGPACAIVLSQAPYPGVRTRTTSVQSS